jgi:hypothetical protein
MPSRAPTAEKTVCNIHDGPLVYRQNRIPRGSLPSHWSREEESWFNAYWSAPVRRCLYTKRAGEMVNARAKALCDFVEARQGPQKTQFVFWDPALPRPLSTTERRKEGDPWVASTKGLFSRLRSLARPPLQQHPQFRQAERWSPRKPCPSARDPPPAGGHPRHRASPRLRTAQR